MKKILISPYSSKHPEAIIRPDLKNWKNPKDYPWWNEVVLGLKQLGYYVIQVGVSGEKPINSVDEFKVGLSFKELLSTLKGCVTYISVDNFFHHFAHYYGITGIVIFGKSDPDLFGYKDNRNLLKDKKYLRPDQYRMWTQTDYNEDVFVNPSIVLSEVIKTSPVGNTT